MTGGTRSGDDQVAERSSFDSSIIDMVFFAGVAGLTGTEAEVAAEVEDFFVPFIQENAVLRNSVGDIGDRGLFGETGADTEPEHAAAAEIASGVKRNALC